MPFYNQEEIEKAREVDLFTYLQACEPQELVHVSGNVYCTREHDSLRISNGKWCWFSRGIGEARFHGDVSGSDKHYSFALPACVENPAVHLCECAIDVMSYATLCKLDGMDWRRHNLLSLAGIYQPKKKIEESKLPAALTRFLEDHPHVKTLYLHLDNDGPGRLAAKAILAAIPEGYEVKNRPPPQGKDVNDFLCHRLEIPIRSAKGKELER